MADWSYSREIVEAVEDFEEDHEEMLEAIELCENEDEVNGVLAVNGVTRAGYDEYLKLQAINESCSGGDWNYGVALVADENWVSYVQDMLAETDQTNRIPSYIVIDWDATAENIKQDYRCFDLDGTTYWYRA